jgi:hypothetical protein
MVMRRAHMGPASAGRKAGSFGSDTRGQVSFSVIAVVLLVSSAVAGTYFAKNQMDEIRSEQKARLLNAMERGLIAVQEELSLCAASRAQSVMNGWDEFPINESRISEAFDSSMREYIIQSFPRTGKDYDLEVTNWTGGLYFVERNTIDLLPSGASSRDSVEIEGQQVAYDRLSAPSDETLGVVTTNPYYVAVGNFTVGATSNFASLVRALSFQRPIISALPFLESKLRAFESSSAGECADLGRQVSYMLSTLAQLRVLEGYGQQMFTSGSNTSEILTEEDVYRAVAVGLLLEQLRLFRTYDHEFASQVESVCVPGAPGVLAINSSRPRELDPAELFLWFLGETDVSLDARTLVAQAVFGFADQLVLKSMEYFGLLGAFDAVKGAVEGLASTVDSLISYFTGQDKAYESVRSWILRSLGATTSDSGQFTSLFSSPTDLIVPIPERAYYVEDAEGNLYPVWLGNITASVDLPVYDLLSSDAWKDFYPEFKECQASAKQLISDSVTRMAFDIASESELQIDGMTVDPGDGKDLFASLAGGTGSVRLKLDPYAVAEAGKSLPLFSAQYELASTLSEFVVSRGLSLVDFGALTKCGYESLAEAALDSARYSFIPDLVVPVKQQLAEIVRSDLEFDFDWGVGGAFSETLASIMVLYLGSLARQVNCSAYKCDDGFAGPMVDSFASMLAFGTNSFPGLQRIVEDSISLFAKDILLQEDISAAKRAVYVDNGGRFQFWEGDRQAAEAAERVIQESVSVNVPGGLPGLRTVAYEPQAGYSSLENLFPTGEFLVQVKRPWDYERDRSEYPNTHLTDLANISAKPYSTQWSVSVLGLIELKASSNNSELKGICDDAAESATGVRVEISVPIVVHSAWPLMGVEYNPSNTVLSDTIDAMKRFADLIWDKLGRVVGWVMDGLERMFGFAARVFEVMSSFATKIVKSFTSALETLVGNLQEFVQKVADSALARAVKMFLDITGRVEFRISMFGLVITVQTSLPDLIYRHGTDLLRLMVHSDRFGPGITLGMRVARMTDGTYDVLANGTLSMKSAKIDVAIDPLMRVLRRFVEAHCVTPTWGLDLMIPEVEPYDSAKVSTSDLPGIGGFLSNIPLPVLGLSASVEAGLLLKYSSPFPTDIVINEFESNPQGEDAGNEWVELYNPLKEAKTVDGWTLSTVHGKSSSMEISGTIPAYGVEVFTFPCASIDNGNPDDPFNDGDSVVLTDQDGRTVDATPMLRDTTNDGRTNQRNWDGGPKWVFQDGSMDCSNGPPALLVGSDFIAKALFEAFKEAFIETKLEEVSASLGFVQLFAKRVLNNFIENILAMVKEIIHEVVFYLAVELSDASGSAGIGFRASFVVSGDAIVDLLRWLIHSLATFIVNLGRALNPIAYPPFPAQFFGGLYLRFEVLFEVGLPRMMRVLGPADGFQESYCLACSISPNLPAIGKLVGKRWGSWEVDFGACIEGLPKEFASKLFTVSGGSTVDFWLLKGRVYGT